LSPRLTVRDYKQTGRRGGGSNARNGRWRDIGIGLGIGLLIALAIFLRDQRQLDSAEAQQPKPRAPAKTQPQAAADTEEPAPQYDFYDMLPKFEVVVPEKERDVRRDLPTARVERPGVYVLQAGSYRNQADAERVRTQLGRQGITATVQRVAVDTDVWHRVRVGPIRELNQVNRMRESLRAADIDALVIRVGD
jgi:cell division protein FtsN